MRNYDFGPSGSGPYMSGDSGEDKGHSVFSLVVLIAVVAVAAVVALSLAFWVLGIVFGLFGWILKVALLAAVAALVWRRVTRGRCGRRV